MFVEISLPSLRKFENLGDVDIFYQNVGHKISEIPAMGSSKLLNFRQQLQKK